MRLRTARLPLPARRRIIPILLLVAGGATACGGEPETRAGPADSGAADTSKAGDIRETADGAADACPPPPAASGTARARKLACSADLPTGFMASARVGDYVLENVAVRFVVRAGPEGHAVMGLVGGDVIDAVRIGPDGAQIGTDSLREWVPTVAMHLVRPDTVETAREDGGKTAVVRVRGKLVPFPTAHAVIALDTPDAEVVHEYRLRADTTALEIRTILTPSAGKLAPLLIGDAVFLGGAVALYRPTAGLPDSGRPVPPKLKVFGVAPVRADPDLLPAAFGFDEPVTTLAVGGMFALLQPNAPIPAAGRTVIRRLVVGGDGPDSLAAAMATAGHLPTGTLKGSVKGGVPGTVIECYDAEDRPLTRCRTSAGGSFECPAPVATQWVRALWIGNGNGQVGGKGQAGQATKAVVQAGKTTEVTVPAPAPARLHVVLRDAATGTGIPFQARLLPGGKIAGIGERVYIDGDGDATFLLPPGKWTVWLHHGPEWSAHHETVELAAGQSVPIEASLAHVVDTTGWIAADTHIHAEHSADSSVPNRERILDAIAVGLDYAIATDHDFVTDYQPWLKAAGVADQITVASGVEVSTISLGHHQLWPVVPDPDKSGNGAPSWYGKKPAELMSMLGADDQQVHQLNHPRGSQSYLAGIDYDPKTTPDELLTFDAIEVLNGKRIGDTEQVLGDWFSLLDRGLHPTATGSSDSHVLAAGVGAARTWVWLGMGKDGKGLDCQGYFKAADADAAILAGRAVASTGPMMVLELMAGGVTRTVGETLQGAKGEVTARVTVVAPDWMPLGRVSIFRNVLEVQVTDIGKTPVHDGVRTAVVSFTAPAAKEEGWWSAVLRPNKGDVRPPIQWRPVWAVSNPVYESP